MISFLKDIGKRAKLGAAGYFSLFSLLSLPFIDGFIYGVYPLLHMLFFSPSCCSPTTLFLLRSQFFFTWPHPHSQVQGLPPHGFATPLSAEETGSSGFPRRFQVPHRPNVADACAFVSYLTLWCFPWRQGLVPCLHISSPPFKCINVVLSLQEITFTYEMSKVRRGEMWGSGPGRCRLEIWLLLWQPSSFISVCSFTSMGLGCPSKTER